MRSTRPNSRRLDLIA